MNYYAGIGSRETPSDICWMMKNFASLMEIEGFTLRSGGAEGADIAFASGVQHNSNKQIFLPWLGFNKQRGIVIDDLPQDILHRASDLARHHHPAWHNCSQAVRKLHTRNVFQVLGANLESPVRFVVCWTKRGSGTGGTGQALRIARDHNIQIFDLGGDIEKIKRSLSQYVEWIIQEKTSGKAISSYDPLGV